MSDDGAQAELARNGADRVKIRYEVEDYGSKKPVELPFVVGVLADLSAKSLVKAKPVANREFTDIDRATFDTRMAAIRPRAVVNVKDTSDPTGKATLSAALEFTQMDDFNPDAIARQVPALRDLLDRRTRLYNFITYMDGKSGAEALIEQALGNEALLQALASMPAQAAPVQPVDDSLAKE